MEAASQRNPAQAPVQPEPPAADNLLQSEWQSFSSSIMVFASHCMLCALSLIVVTSSLTETTCEHPFLRSKTFWWSQSPCLEVLQVTFIHLFCLSLLRILDGRSHPRYKHFLFLAKHSSK